MAARIRSTTALRGGRSLSDENGQEVTVESERDVGEMGEQVLGTWAAEVGVTANKARRDRSGWDYIVELPLANVDGAVRPLDRASAPVQCLVQVKSTDEKRKASWSVKLDNWWRLVTSQLPAFFLVLEFDGESNPRRAYLVHVGESLIRKVLLALRKASAARSKKPLRHRTVSFKRTAADAFTPLNGQGLLAALQRHVQPNAAAYAAEKQRLVRELGYETRGTIIEGTASFAMSPGSTPDEELIRFALGLQPELPIEPGAMVWDERFGIRLPDPARTIVTTGKLVAQPLGGGEIRLRTPHGAAVTLPVHVFTSGAVRAFVTDPTVRVRFATRYVDFFTSVIDLEQPGVFGPFSLQLKEPDPDERQPLEQLLEYAELLGVLRTCGPDSPATIDFAIDQFRFGGSANIDGGSVHIDYEDLAKAIHEAWTVLRRFGLPPAVGVSINDLWRQRKTLTRMAAVFRNDVAGIRITFDESDVAAGGRPVCVPGHLQLEVADRHLVLAFAVLAPPRSTEAMGGRRGEVVTGFAGHEMAVHAASVDPSSILPDLLERVAQRFETTHFVYRS
jgi:hypothetical protein